jgi:hypothetical protein
MPLKVKLDRLPDVLPHFLQSGASEDAPPGRSGTYAL